MNIAGIDIGGTSIKIGILDEKLNVLAKTKLPTPQGEDVRSASAACANALADMGIPYRLAGIACAGHVEPGPGRVTAVNIGWNDEPLRDAMCASLNVPVYVENDAQAAMMAEWLEGGCKGMRHAVYITLGTGVGGGIIVNGQPYPRGTNNAGSEIGHMVTHINGRECPCGSKGCFERYASARALSEMAGGISTERVFELAAQGDPDMLRVLDEYAEELCAGLVTLNWIFAPQAIVFGGGLSNAGKPLLNLIQRHFDAHVSGMSSAHKPRLELARYLNDSGIMGGAAAALYNHSAR